MPSGVCQIRCRGRRPGGPCWPAHASVFGSAGLSDQVRRSRAQVTSPADGSIRDNAFGGESGVRVRHRDGRLCATSLVGLRLDVLVRYGGRILTVWRTLAPTSAPPCVVARPSGAVDPEATETAAETSATTIGSDRARPPSRTAPRWSPPPASRPTTPRRRRPPRARHLPGDAAGARPVEHLLRDRARRAEPGRRGPPLPGLRAQRGDRHRHGDRPRDPPGHRHLPERLHPPARRPVLRPPDALRAEQQRQHDHADRSRRPASPARPSRRQPLQPVLPARRQRGDRRGRGQPAPRLRRPAHLRGPQLAPDRLLRPEPPRRLGRRSVRHRHLRVRRAHHQGRPGGPRRWSPRSRSTSARAARSTRCCHGPSPRTCASRPTARPSTSPTSSPTAST